MLRRTPASNQWKDRTSTPNIKRRECPQILRFKREFMIRPVLQREEDDPSDLSTVPYFPDAAQGVIGAVEINGRVLTPAEVTQGLREGGLGFFSRFARKYIRQGDST